jgi:hypothetical protein
MFSSSCTGFVSFRLAAVRAVVRAGIMAIFALVVALATSCSTPVTPDPAISAFRQAARAPAVRVGPIIDLLSGRTSREKVKVVADGGDQVRVLIASTELQQVLELVVRREGVVQRRVVAPHASPWSIDAAFDNAGKFHALVDTDHLVLEDGVWRKSERTPWHEAGVTPKGLAHFVPGAPRLIWAFQVAGSVVGASRRLEIWGIGGGAGALLWPWFTSGQRAVIVAEAPTGFGPWVVLEPQAKSDTRIEALAADHSGAAYVRYIAQTGGMGGTSEGRYAHISAALLGGTKGPDSGTAGTRGTEGGTGQLLGISGGVDDEKDCPSALAADPESGIALVGLRVLLSGRDLIAGPLDLPLDVRVRNPDVRTAAAGGDAFHALVTAAEVGQKDSRFAWYMLFSEGKWSAPIQLGATGVASFWGTGWDAYGITSLPSGTAFLVWPTEGGLIGRWVERIK